MAIRRTRSGRMSDQEPELCESGISSWQLSVHGNR